MVKKLTGLNPQELYLFYLYIIYKDKLLEFKIIKIEYNLTLYYNNICKMSEINIENNYNDLILDNSNAGIEEIIRFY